MQFLANFKISRMIMAVAVVPILAMIFFSTEIVLKEIDRSKAMDDLGQLTSLAVKLSNLVHEQQKERGATAVYVGSSGEKFSSELASQRRQTNKKTEELKAYISGMPLVKFGETFNQKLQAIMAALAKMDAIRKRVDALSISNPEAIGYYTRLNGQNLKLVEYMGTLSPDTVIFSRFVGFSSFLQAKERAGIERAVGATSFASGKFTHKAMDKFKELISVQNTYNTVFLSHATDEEIAKFKGIMSAKAATEVQRMREIAFAGGLDGRLEGISGKTWFDTITGKISGLKQIEDTLSTDLLNELATLEAGAKLDQWKAIVMTLMAIVTVVGFCLLIIRSINGSFKTIISAMKKLADGDLDVMLPPAKANEIGEIVNCVQVFKDNATEKVKLEKREGEVAIRNEQDKRQSMQKLANDFDSNVGCVINTISSASTELDSTAQSMASISEETSCQASAVSAACQQASGNVQTVASATEEMVASILEINTQVVDASHVSKKAVEHVTTTAEQMADLAQTVNKIGEVVSLISDIAEQTNLLALNATIESARAGEAGKGFAVVASEVKTLANETAQATESITALIQEIKTATGNAVSSIDDIGTVIRQLEESSTAIAAAMEEQGATTQEVSRSIQEIASGTHEVSSNIAGVTQASQETGSASGEVTAAAGELSRQAETLKGQVDSFLEGLREGCAGADRRVSDDPDYSGPERRLINEENVAA